MIIKIDDGDTFEGTAHMFGDCFLINRVTVFVIRNWCLRLSSKLEFILEDGEEMPPEHQLLDEFVPPKKEELCQVEQ